MRASARFGTALLAAVALGWSGASGAGAGADDPPPAPAPGPPPGVEPAQQPPARAPQPAPAPVPPPVPAQASPVATWTYLGSAAVGARLEALAQRKGADLPAVTVTEYGRSAAQKPLLALWIGTPGKPCVLVHGGLAWNDAAGTVACLDLAERLLAPEGAGALESVSYVLLPAPNPDALDAFVGQAALGLAKHAGVRAGGGLLDRDHDGAKGEDGPDDLDGDGAVLQMRRRSANGTWAAAETVEPPRTPQADPRRMVERGPDARRPVSYEVLAEGRDDDGDGAVNEDPPGMDLTRQMAGWWDHQGPWKGEGGFAGQAPEARALMELSFGLSNLLAWYGFRSEGPVLLRASENGALAEPDNGLYDQVAAALKARVGIDTKRASELSGGRANPGSDLDWAAVHLGVVAFALPVWRIAKEEGYGVDRPWPDEVDWLLWNDRVLAGEGFVAWNPFNHPTLGAVEIGGWKPATRHEPPAALLSDAVHAVSSAPLAHAAFAPRLDVDVRVHDRGSGLFEVRARVTNTGGGPTDTALAAQRRRDMPVRLALVPEDGVERVAGPGKADLGTIAPGAFSAEVTWLVRRAPPRANRAPDPLLAALRAEHRVAGKATVEVKAP